MHLSNTRAKQIAMHLHSSLGEDMAVKVLPCTLHTQVSSPLL